MISKSLAELHLHWQSGKTVESEKKEAFRSPDMHGSVHWQRRQDAQQRTPHRGTVLEHP